MSKLIGHFDSMVNNIRGLREAALAINGVDVIYDVPNQKILIVPVTPEAA